MYLEEKRNNRSTLYFRTLLWYSINK